MTQSIGWGLIGASRIAADWMIGAIRAQDDSDVVAVMSSSQEWGAAYAREHGIARAYDDLDALLADPGVDAVYISTTNDLHCAQTVAAAEAGKHVLCEKPLALTLADARRMVDACAAAGVHMGTNHHMRNATGHRAIRDIVKEGRIGQIRSARICFAIVLPERFHDWRLNDRDGGGPILDLGVHLADTMRFLLDDEPRDVVAQSVNHGMTVAGLEDEAMSVVRTRGGVLVNLFPSWAATYTESDIEILGSEGFVRARNALMPDTRRRRGARHRGGPDDPRPGGRARLRARRPPLQRSHSGRWRAGVHRPRRHAFAGPGARHPRGGRNGRPRGSRDVRARSGGAGYDALSRGAEGPVVRLRRAQIINLVEHSYYSNIDFRRLGTVLDCFAHDAVLSVDGRHQRGRDSGIKGYLTQLLADLSQHPPRGGEPRGGRGRAEVPFAASPCASKTPRGRRTKPPAGPSSVWRTARLRSFR